MTTIKVNVFNLTPLNSVFSCCKVGVYHSSVVIGEKYEFYYGFAAWGYPGIDSPEHVNQLPSSMTGTFHSSYVIGESQMELEDCRAIAVQMKHSDAWLSDRYNLIMHNCNDFSKALSTVLCGEEAVKQNYPFWVSRGERIGKLIYSISVSHFLCYIKGIPSLTNPNAKLYEEDIDKSASVEHSSSVDDIENVNPSSSDESETK